MADPSLSLEIGHWRKVLPFWVSYLLFPLIWASAILGGWWVLLTPLLAWYLFSLLDLAFGLSHANEDPATDVSALAGYRWATLLWMPAQFVSIFGLLIYVSQSGHLNFWEQLGLFFSLGVMSGTIGINYSHELMHQKTAHERWMADGLLAMVLYSHFRSEHLLVHHRYVGTPRDPVTARYNESFYHFFPRVLRQCFFFGHIRRAGHAAPGRARVFPSEESAVAICCIAGWLCALGFWYRWFCRGAPLCFSGVYRCLAVGAGQLY
jgi:alkane 1-monooxygenase